MAKSLSADALDVSRKIDFDFKDVFVTRPRRRYPQISGGGINQCWRWQLICNVGPARMCGTFLDCVTSWETWAADSPRRRGRLWRHDLDGASLVIIHCAQVVWINGGWYAWFGIDCRENTNLERADILIRCLQCPSKYSWMYYNYDHCFHVMLVKAELPTEPTRTKYISKVKLFCVPFFFLLFFLL